ncbi:MAG: radical SAM protein [Canidatus Methanoxibalbensis ujae]|nr:radical SAM protein [Candidatus Methanoxibalbensis ujae]MCW7078504.1 radical SAM protein [Candidatus Methanoxibalbensis ujae]
MISEYEDEQDKVFLLRNFIEVRISKKRYEKLAKKYTKEHIISFKSDKTLNHFTQRPLIFITKESGIPLLGHPAFGVIDRGTNLIQVRPVTGCNLNCIFCSVDEGRASRTRRTDYIVEPEYLAEVFDHVSSFKGEGVEAHIDCQGEPLIYPYMEELLERIKNSASVVSIQTNGIFINERKLEILEKYVTRINLSLNTLDERRADFIHGARYPLKHVLRVAEMIAKNTTIDLLIAPVWLPGINDEDIPRIIDFALDIGAGKRFPPLGIQKFIKYKTGRKPKIKRYQTFDDFYRRLQALEKEYGVKLVLHREDFGIERRPRIPSPIKKGERLKARIIAEGRTQNEMLCVVRNRVVSVITEKKTGDFVNFEVKRTKDGLFLGVEI